jgi:hypothetical protein
MTTEKTQPPTKRRGRPAKTEPSAAPKTTEPKLKVKAKSPKDLATEKGLPWVSVVSVELDPDNIGNGAFELDWNEKFVANLIRAGYQGKTDADLVDQWFRSVCQNVLNENYEQWEANQPTEIRPRVVDKKDLGNGRTEVS